MIAETGWLLLDRDGPVAQQRFIGSVVAGDIDVIDLSVGNWHSGWKLCGIYAGLGLDVIDASTIAAAERLEQIRIATLGRRDFAVVRPIHATSFELLPEPA